LVREGKRSLVSLNTFVRLSVENDRVSQSDADKAKAVTIKTVFVKELPRDCNCEVVVAIRPQLFAENLGFALDPDHRSSKRPRPLPGRQVRSSGVVLSYHPCAHDHVANSLETGSSL
jgi:hypothetical protein